MSIRVMSLVWEVYPGGGSELLAMLALADWSDDAGRCYPSMAAIARKVRLERRQAQRVIHSLIDDGFLEVTGNLMGGAPGSSRQYRIALERLTGVADDTGVMEDTGVADDADGCHGRHGCRR